MNPITNDPQVDSLLVLFAALCLFGINAFAIWKPFWRYYYFASGAGLILFGIGAWGVRGPFIILGIVQILAGIRRIYLEHQMQNEEELD